MLTSSTILVFSLALPTFATQYNIIKDYSGQSFFNDWDFYNNYDNLTNGDAIFVGRDNQNLAYVDSSTGRAIIKVDNTTNVVYNDKRNTVRIQSSDSYDVGSVFVADFYHVPYGCSVWPAWWSQAPNWPTGGEIDTFEGVNLVSNNQMALHTTQGCTQANAVQTSTLVNSTDCGYQTNSNEGCVVTDPSTTSYGEAFAQAGGGVFVTEFASSGISIWFFARSNVPQSLTSNSSSIDLSNFGTPVANWPTSGCNIGTYFGAQHLILDITLCGDFAGSASVFAQTCSGTCYTDYVVGSGSNYSTAYFDIASVRVYSSNKSSNSTSSNTSNYSAAISSWSPFAVLSGFASLITLYL